MRAAAGAPEFDREVFLERSNKCVRQLLKSWTGLEEFRAACHFLFEKSGVRHSSSPGEHFPIHSNRHRAVLQEGAADAALRAADNFASFRHQFVPRRRQKTRRICPAVEPVRLAGIGREDSRNAKAIESQAQSLGYAFVIAVDGISEG